MPARRRARLITLATVLSPDFEARYQEALASDPALALRLLEVEVRRHLAVLPGRDRRDRRRPLRYRLDHNRANRAP